jgi:glycosyltransferase 2 family protein
VKRSNVVKNVLLYAIGFGLLAYIIWTNWEPKGKSPGIKGLLDQSPTWPFLAGAAVLLAFTQLCQFSRWYLLVRAVDLPFTYRNALRLGLVGFFYNTFLPGSIGGDAVKGFFLWKGHPTRRAVAIATLIIDRLFGLFGLLLFVAVVGGGSWLAGDPKIEANGYLRKIIAVGAATVAVAVVGWIVMGLLSEHMKSRLEARLHRIRWVGKTLAEVFFAVRTYRRRPGIVFLSILISAASHVSMVFTFHLTVRVFPAIAVDAATLAEHFIIAPVGYIAQVFFPVPGGVGGAEAIFGYLYTLIGREEVTGTVGRLTLRAVEWALGFLGYLVFLRMKKELPMDTTTPPVPPPAE